MCMEYESLAAAVADVSGAEITEKRAVPGGDINGEPGNTDTIKVVTVTEAQTVIV